MDSFIRFFSIKPGAGYLKRVCEWGYKNQAEGRGHINGWMFMGSLSFISYFFFYYPRLKKPVVDYRRELVHDALHHGHVDKWH